MIIIIEIDAVDGVDAVDDVGAIRDAGAIDLIGSAKIWALNARGRRVCRRIDIGAAFDGIDDADYAGTGSDKGGLSARNRCSMTSNGRLCGNFTCNRPFSKEVFTTNCPFNAGLRQILRTTAQSTSQEQKKWQPRRKREEKEIFSSKSAEKRSAIEREVPHAQPEPERF
ncbi:MAG: hypothetical protein LKJ44_01765 [Bifidobacteriaceae bacterium]|jgi:hypothetical protein|nr:hypothetical protein [Bifidobacteriaceae bacterium]MCI1978435.1 hypothetical protein [Bifidobacteriaceae bacterium]